MTVQGSRSFPLIEICGAPFERGKMHGELAENQVRLSAHHYVEQIEKMGLSRADIADMADEFLPKLRDWAPDLVAEMEGISAGAGVPFEHIVLINARTELLQLAKRKSKDIKVPSDGCTGAVIMPAASKTKTLLHGQTWDWKYECIETSLVIRILRDNGPDILTFTEAGALVRNGFNSSGTVITGNYLECDRDYKDLGIPLTFIRRKALETDCFATTLKIITTTPKSGSNNMIVSSAEGFAVNLECAPDEVFPIYPKNGLLVHANHWQSEVALGKLKETGFEEVPDSLYRDYRVRELFAEKHGNIDLGVMGEVFDDRFGSPFSVCRPIVKEDSGNLSATVATVLCDPKNGAMYVTALPADGNKPVRYDIVMDVAKAA